MIKQLILLGTILLSQDGFSSDFSCHLDIPGRIAKADSATITFTLTNQNHSPVRVLTWYTPLEGFWSNLFEISNHRGETLDYQGPIAKRLKPDDEDYLTIAARETVTVELDLTQVYSLPRGHYTLKINNENTNLPCWQSLRDKTWTFEIEN